MLKIKDNIDLKELEKFGFKQRDKDEIASFFIDDWSYYGGIFILNDKSISLSGDISCEIGKKLLDKLYNLIKSDLIDKIEEG